MANTKAPDSTAHNTISVPKDTIITGDATAKAQASANDPAKTLSATKLSTDKDAPFKPTDPQKNDETTAAPGGKKAHVASTKKPAKEVYVKLSDVPHDILPKKTVSDMVNNSQISMHHKRKIWAQVNEGALSPDYAAAVKAIQLAASQGSQYRPGQDGL